MNGDATEGAGLGGAAEQVGCIVATNEVGLGSATEGVLFVDAAGGPGMENVSR